MANEVEVLNTRNGKGTHGLFNRTLRLPIATKLILSYLAIIILTSTIFLIAGIQLIGNRIVAETVLGQLVEDAIVPAARP